MSHAVPTPAAAAAPAPGWYPDPAGSPAQRWWDGAAWTQHLHAATQVPVVAQTPVQPAYTPTATVPVVPASGAGSGPGFSMPRLTPKLVVAVVVAVIAVGGFVVKLAHSSIDVEVGTGAGAQTVKADGLLKIDMRESESALDVYYKANKTYAVPGMHLGLTLETGDMVEVKTTSKGYCLRGSNPASVANGQAYYWFDSTAGGLQQAAAPVSATEGAAGATCSGGGLFVPVD